MQVQTLASKLQNRVEIWRREKVKTKIGDSFDDILYKTVWADVIPLNANIASGQADTENSRTKFKVLMRKTDVLQSDFLIFKGLKLEIDYIIPNFDRKGYIEVYALLVKE